MYSFFPDIKQALRVNLVYQTAIDGVSYRNFTAKTSEVDTVLIVIRTFKYNTEYVFGVYLNKWDKAELGKVSGNGECRIFAVSPDFELFKWEEHCCLSGRLQIKKELRWYESRS